MGVTQEEISRNRSIHDQQMEELLAWYEKDKEEIGKFVRHVVTESKKVKMPQLELIIVRLAHGMLNELIYRSLEKKQSEESSCH